MEDDTIDYRQQFRVAVTNLVNMNLMEVDKMHNYITLAKCLKDFPDLFKFVEKLVNVYENSPKKTRFIHYIGSMAYLEQLIESKLYEPLTTELVPKCKCKNKQGQYTHDHSMVKTILTSSVINNRLWRKRKANGESKGEKTTSIEIKNLNHFINTILYICCTKSTTNNVEHDHFDNKPFKITYLEKVEILKALREKYNLEQQQDQFANRKSSFKRKWKKVAWRKMNEVDEKVDETISVE